MKIVMKNILFLKMQIDINKNFILLKRKNKSIIIKNLKKKNK